MVFDLAEKQITITDIVDTIEDLLPRFARAEDIIEEHHHMQPSPLAHFNEQMGRLRTLLDEQNERDIVG